MPGRLRLVAGVSEAAATTLRRLAGFADETAADLRRAEFRAGLDERADPDPYGPQVPAAPAYVLPFAAPTVDALVRDALDAWYDVSRRAADELEGFMSVLRASSGLDVARTLTPAALGTHLASVVQGAPITVEAWIVTVSRRGEFVVGGGVEDVFEVRRLNNGRYRVLHRATGSVYVEGGVEAAAGFRVGDRIVGIDAAATAAARLRVDNEDTFTAGDMDEVKLLITQAVIASTGMAQTLLGRPSSPLGAALTAARISPVNQAAFGWLSDRGEDAGLPNLKEAYDAYMKYRPAFAQSYVGVGTDLAAGATARLGTEWFDLTRGVEGSISRSWGDLRTATGGEGKRVTLSGSALADLDANGTGLAASASSTVQVEWFENSETRSPAAVTAIVTAFEPDSMTTRTITFDLTTPEGRTAARTVVNAAVAPVPSREFLDRAPEALDILTGDDEHAGVRSTEQTYTMTSDDYGLFVDVSFGPAFEVDVNVNVTHLE